MFNTWRKDGGPVQGITWGKANEWSSMRAWDYWCHPGKKICVENVVCHIRDNVFNGSVQ